jgi:hypothetical protein
MDLLQYPALRTFSCEVDNRDPNGAVANNIVTSWMLYGKLPQTVFTKPEYREQLIVASGANRFLSSVTIDAIPTTVVTVSLAAAATLKISNSQAVSATSSDAAVATAAISSGIITITAIAAGTSTITVEDVNSDSIYVIEVTVA